MSKQVFPLQLRLLKNIMLISGITLWAVVVIGTASLIGWALDIAILKSIIPGMATMKVNTALCFILLSVAWLIHHAANKSFNKLSQILSIICLLIAAVTMVEYFSGLDFGIDQLIFADADTPAYQFPGRMSEATAIGFMFCSVSYWLSFSNLKKVSALSQALAIIVLFLALFAFISYMLNTNALYSIEVYSSLALNTAICFIFLAVGILVIESGTAPMNIVLNNTLGGLLMRKVLPGIFILLIVTGWLCSMGVKYELYGREFSMILFIFFNMFFVGGYLLNIGKQLAILDRENEHKKEEIVAINEELSAKNEELHMLDQEKNRFLGMASHDLKNQLTAMMLSLNIVSDKEEISPAVLEVYVSRLLRNAMNMNRMVDNFLSINRIQQGIVRVDISDMAIGELARQMVYEYEEIASSKKISIELTDDSKELTIKSDVNYINIILDNLISNAVKYTHFEKKVFVRIFQERDRAPIIIEVEDEGQGISASEMPKMFRRFQKLGSVPTAGEPSTGLGLAIVKDIVTALKGTISCTSEVNIGTKFRVELPV